MGIYQQKNYGLITGKDLRKPGGMTVYILFFLIAIVVALVSIIPPLWILLSGFKDIKEIYATPPTFVPQSFHPENFALTWQKLDFGVNYLNSFILIVGACICSVFFNGLLAYVLSKLRPRGHKFVYYMVMWSLMIPSTISLVPLFMNINAVGLTQSFVPLWLSFGANAFNVLLYKNFFDDIPDSLVEAAKIDGASNARIFFQLIVPLSGPIIMVIVIFTFNAAWSEYLLSYLVLDRQTQQTVMLALSGMSNIKAFGMDLRLIAITFSIIPPVVLFMIFQRQITQGITLSGIKG